MNGGHFTSLRSPPLLMVIILFYEDPQAGLFFCEQLTPCWYRLGNYYQESSGVVEVHRMAMITTLGAAAPVSETEDRHRLVKKLNAKRFTSSCYNYIIILPLFILLHFLNAFVFVDQQLR